MSRAELVPDRLRGVWKRLEIRRKRNDWKSHTGTEVCYLQTPFAFVDIRRLKGKKDGEKGKKDGESSMAFGGYTTFVEDKVTNTITVRWHTIYDVDADEVRDGWKRSWENILARGKESATDDVGIFTRDGTKKDIWIETDPKNTLKEVWQKISDGNGQFLSLLKRNTRDTLLVVVGNSWAIADAGLQRYTSGYIERHPPSSDSGRPIKGPTMGGTERMWVPSMEVASPTPSGAAERGVVDEKGRLVLPGSNIKEYDILPGSTLKITELPGVVFRDSEDESRRGL
eukprot:g5488.t1